jgi:hypothetical protein
MCPSNTPYIVARFDGSGPFGHERVAALDSRHLVPAGGPPRGGVETDSPRGVRTTPWSRWLAVVLAGAATERSLGASAPSRTGASRTAVEHSPSCSRAERAGERHAHEGAQRRGGRDGIRPGARRSDSLRSAAATCRLRAPGPFAPHGRSEQNGRGRVRTTVGRARFAVRGLPD